MRVAVAPGPIIAAFPSPSSSFSPPPKSFVVAVGAVVVAYFFSLLFCFVFFLSGNRNEPVSLSGPALGPAFTPGRRSCPGPLRFLMVLLFYRVFFLPSLAAIRRPALALTELVGHWTAFIFGNITGELLSFPSRNERVVTLGRLCWPLRRQNWQTRPSLWIRMGFYRVPMFYSVSWWFLGDSRRYGWDEPLLKFSSELFHCDLGLIFLDQRSSIKKWIENFTTFEYRVLLPALAGSTSFSLAPEFSFVFRAVTGFYWVLTGLKWGC